MPKSRSPRMIVWEKPPKGWLKLNVDGLVEETRDLVEAMVLFETRMAT